LSKLVVAIDGPAGAGKSTVAKAVAQRLGLSYLDTGAMYRALALKAQRSGLGPDDGEAAASLGEASNIDFGQGDPQPVLLDGEDVTSQIRTMEIGELASALSAHTPVRRVLVKRQKELVQAGGVTLEGRDATTVIAPDADVKIYLTASLEERARRRHKELIVRGQQADYEEIKRLISERDHRDMNRADSPLRVAEGACVVETDGLSADEAVTRILELCESLKGSG
jgi:CMP/dCMP kinase